jgi:hypothetical protein
LAKRATSIVATATTTAANKEPSVVCAPPISNIGQLSMLSSVSNELILPWSGNPLYRDIIVYQLGGARPC